MEQDSRTMSLLIRVHSRFFKNDDVRVYSSNFTEEPGVYIETETTREFIPCDLNSSELDHRIREIQNKLLC